MTMIATEPNRAATQASVVAMKSKALVRASVPHAPDAAVSSWIRVLCALIVAGGAPATFADAADGESAERRAAVAAARAEVERAQAVVAAATARVRSSWKANNDYIAAEEELSNARRDFDRAREGVVEKLKNDPAYSAALRDEADAAARVRNEQAETNATQPATTRPAGANESGPNLPAPSDEQVRAATDRLNQKSKVRDLQDAAVNADPEASKARDRLDLAQRQMKVWQLQLDAALKNDPEYKAGMEQLAAARAKVPAAAASHPDRDTRTRH